MDANVFELNNENIRIIYYAQGDSSQPTLTYEDSDVDKTFRGPEIRVVQTDIGQLVTVTLKKGIDQGTIMLSLLLPTVTVAAAGTSVTIETKAIVTTLPKVIGLNLPGANQTYRVESLHGTAQFAFARTAAPAGAKAQTA
jgi:hypothetical protein